MKKLNTPLLFYIGWLFYTIGYLSSKIGTVEKELFQYTWTTFIESISIIIIAFIYGYLTHREQTKK